MSIIVSSMVLVSLPDSYAAILTTMERDQKVGLWVTGVQPV